MRTKMHMEDRVSVPGEVVPFEDPTSGARGAIVLHSTILGPAAGGCRLTRYPSDADAVTDALRLAEGMTLKNALADLPFGGGKAVIRMPAGPFDRKKLFQAVGRAVEELGGRYITAEDVGTGVADMITVAGETRYVAGLPAASGEVGGDPSPWTALGVLAAMRVAVRHRLGAGLSDVTVAVQGTGHVGAALCELLHEAGARLIVSEPRSEIASRIAVRFGAMVMGSAALLDAPADVFAPCALGGAINEASIARLRMPVVCGAANNQLTSPEMGARLADRGILYTPDFLVNAGGIINVAAEYLGWSQVMVKQRIDAIGPRTAEVLNRADAQGVLPERAARDLAMLRLVAGARR